MKQTNQKQFAGVWLDHHKAMVITAEDDSGEYAILDKVKAPEEHVGGNEHSIHNTQQSNLLKHFKSVAKLLVKYDEILVFGPGTAQEQFQKHLQEDAQFKSKKIIVDSAGQLTDAQMVAQVRDFFKAR